MNADIWKIELNRLLKMFERESTSSLRKINQCFEASDSAHLFDEEFRKNFLKMSAHRLNSSFNTILFEKCFKNLLQVPSSANEPDNSNGTANNTSMLSFTGNYVDSLFAPEDEIMLDLMIRNNFDAPIEMASSDDGERQMQALSVLTGTQIESNASRELDNGDVVLKFGRNEASGDADGGNGNEVYVKREPKVENENEIETEFMDLPMIEFDPNKYIDSCSKENYPENASVRIRTESDGSMMSGNIDEDPQNEQNGTDANNAELGQGQPRSSSSSKRSAGKLIKCKQCNYGSVQKGNVTRHELIHEDSAGKPFKCKHCDHTSRLADNLKRHQRIHAQQKLMGIPLGPNRAHYKCPHCDQQFNKWDGFRSHLTKSHKNNQRFFNCSRCMRRFARKNEKEKHELRCRNRRYECYLCKKYVTKNDNDMQKHMRTHTGAKPFECAVCNRCFRIESALRRHLNSVHNHA